MRRLILLRHAKSDWPDGARDIDRPLASRGQRAAPLIGRLLARDGLVADRVLVSPARRTRETWDLAREAAADLPPGEIEPRVYEASSAALTALAREQPDWVHVLMIVGHNPGLEMLAAELIDDGPVHLIRKLAQKYPTGALAVIDCPITRWRELKAQTGRLAKFVVPRDLDVKAE